MNELDRESRLVGIRSCRKVWDFTSWFLGKRLPPRVNCSRSSPTAFFWKKIWGFCWEVAEKKKKSHWKLIVYDILWSEKLHLHLCKKRSIPVFVSMWSIEKSWWKHVHPKTLEKEHTSLQPPAPLRPGPTGPPGPRAGLWYISLGTSISWAYGSWAPAFLPPQWWLGPPPCSLEMLINGKSRMVS